MSKQTQKNELDLPIRDEWEEKSFDVIEERAMLPALVPLPAVTESGGEIKFANPDGIRSYEDDFHQFFLVSDDNEDPVNSPQNPLISFQNNRKNAGVARLFSYRLLYHETQDAQVSHSELFSQWLECACRAEQPEKLSLLLAPVRKSTLAYGPNSQADKDFNRALMMKEKPGLWGGQQKHRRPILRNQIWHNFLLPAGGGGCMGSATRSRACGA